MPKIIFHSIPNLEKIKERRLLENLSILHNERMKKLFGLIKLSQLLKKGPIKKPQGKGIMLKFK